MCYFSWTSENHLFFRYSESFFGVFASYKNVDDVEFASTYSTAFNTFLILWFIFLLFFFVLIFPHNSSNCYSELPFSPLVIFHWLLYTFIVNYYSFFCNTSNYFGNYFDLFGTFLKKHLHTHTKTSSFWSFHSIFLPINPLSHIIIIIGGYL